MCVFVVAPAVFASVQKHCRNYCPTISECMRYNWDRTQAPLYLTNKRIIPNDDSFMAYTKEFRRNKNKQNYVAAFFFTATAAIATNESSQRSKRLETCIQTHTSIPQQIATNRFGLLTFRVECSTSCMSRSMYYIRLRAIEWTQSECADIWNICEP